MLDERAGTVHPKPAPANARSIRECYLSLLADIRDPSLSFGKLRARREGLQQQLYKIYRTASHTDDAAYAAAQEGLQRREELTFSNAEIDAFLPAPLKRLGKPSA